MSGSLESIQQFSSTATSNTNIAGINVNIGWPPGNVGAAYRTLMAFLADSLIPLSLEIAGVASITLSAAQAAANWISFTGALTSACTVTLPNAFFVGYAQNSTTGGENIVLTAGGGTTLTLAPGSIWTAYECDGAGNVQPASGLGSVSSAMQPVVSAGSLTAAIQELFSGNETSAVSVYQSIFPGVTFQDNVVGYNTIGSGSTLNQATAVAGYARALVASSGGNQNAVALFGCGTAEVNGANVWGINTLLQDSSSRAVGSGTARILVNEFDFNVMNPATEVIGCSVGGNSLAQPAIANGFIVNSLGSGIKWDGGLVTEDGAATTAISIGVSSATAGPNFASQAIEISFYDNTSTKQVAQISLGSISSGAPGGVLAINGTVPVSLSLGGGNVEMQSGFLVIDGNAVVGPRITGWGTATNGAPIAFDAATATTAQTATALAFVIQCLFNHGLIGT